LHPARPESQKNIPNLNLGYFGFSGLFLDKIWDISNISAKFLPVERVAGSRVASSK
jgi:hypothetical protein